MLKIIQGLYWKKSIFKFDCLKEILRVITYPCLSFLRVNFENFDIIYGLAINCFYEYDMVQMD